MHHIHPTQVTALFALKPVFLGLAVALPSLFIDSGYVNKAYADEPTKIDLAPVAVIGNPLGAGSDELVVPVTVLNGRELS